MKKLLFSITLLLVILAVPLTVFAKTKVDICHATSSQSNPYVKNSPSADGDVSGHDDHDNDIIPPFNYGENHYAGKNWTAEGQAIYYNNCSVPTPTPTATPTQKVEPTPTAEPTPTEEPTPTPTVEVTPTPTQEPTPTPEVTPEPTITPRITPTSTPCGDACKAKEVPKEPITAPQCKEEAISQAVANPHVYRKGDKALVKWYREDTDHRVAIYYGINGQGEQHAVIVSNTGEFMIEGLGTKDFTFWVQYLNGCNSGPKSNAIVDGNTTGWVLFR